MSEYQLLSKLKFEQAKRYYIYKRLKLALGWYIFSSSQKSNCYTYQKVTAENYNEVLAKYNEILKGINTDVFIGNANISTAKIYGTMYNSKISFYFEKGCQNRKQIISATFLPR